MARGRLVRIEGWEGLRIQRAESGSKVNAPKSASRCRISDVEAKQC